MQPPYLLETGERISQIDIDDFVAFAGTLEGEEIPTVAGRARFKVRVLTDGLEFTPLSSMKPRKHTRTYLERVLHQFEKTGSWKAADYDFTVNAQYTLAIVRAYLTKHCRADSQLTSLIKRLQSCLTPDLLKREYRDKNRDNPMYGHCYAATEALFHLIRNSPSWSDYKPHFGKDDNDVTHWWLQDSKGNIIDPTEDQYLSLGKTPPYKKGRAGSFQMGRQTDEPSKRAKMIMDRVAGAGIGIRESETNELCLPLSTEF